MKRTYRATGVLLTAATALSTLNSCYFNSAGHIFAKASRPEAVKLSDITAGSYVYNRGGNYFVELPRYKTGKPVKTQYNALEDDDREEQFQRVYGETAPVSISHELAMYLTGQSGSEQAPRSDGAYVITDWGNWESYEKQCSRMNVTRSLPNGQAVPYRYKSPNAVWWYTLGAFDWLCVDLPMTCVENSLMISLFCCMIPLAPLAAMGADSEPGTTTYAPAPAPVYVPEPVYVAQDDYRTSGSSSSTRQTSTKKTPAKKKTTTQTKKVTKPETKTETKPETKTETKTGSGPYIWSVRPEGT